MPVKEKGGEVGSGREIRDIGGRKLALVKGGLHSMMEIQI